MCFNLERYYRESVWLGKVKEVFCIVYRGNIGVIFGFKGSESYLGVLFILGIFVEG